MSEIHPYRSKIFELYGRNLILSVWDSAYHITNFGTVNYQHVTQVAYLARLVAFSVYLIAVECV